MNYQHHRGHRRAGGGLVMASGQDGQTAARQGAHARKVHGPGVFAARPHPQGHAHHRVRGRTRLACAGRPPLRGQGRERQPHVLFIVDRKIVIDAGVDGNDARFINHCCDPELRVGHRGPARVHRGDPHHRAGRGAGLRLPDRPRARTIRRTSMRSSPAAAVRRTVAAPCCGRRSARRARRSRSVRCAQMLPAKIARAA